MLGGKDYEAIDKTTIWHPFTQMADWELSDNVVIESAKGIYLRDIHGKQYIDGVSSLWCNVHGHQKKKIDDAIRRQLKKVAHSTMLGLTHTAAIDLTEKLLAVAPKGYSRVFYSDNGSTAVEVALKMAYQFWQQKVDSDGHRTSKNKTRFLAFTNAYHGDTLGSVSVGGIPLFSELYRSICFDVHRAPYPDLRAEAGLTEAMLMARTEKRILHSAHELAAVIIEPLVQGAAGMRLSSPRFLRFLSRICDKNSVLLIADEIATGFGRTGTMFASQQAGVCPDIMCVAKGLTGGYLPLAATLTSDYVYGPFLGSAASNLTFFHGHTYTANPLACAAALANLEIFESEKTLAKLKTKIELLAAKLEDFKRLRHVYDIRQCGFMVGIELMQDAEKKKSFAPERRMGHKVCLAAREQGLIIRPLGDVIVLMPPLSISTKELLRILKIVHAAIREVTENYGG